MPRNYSPEGHGIEPADHFKMQMLNDQDLDDSMSTIHGDDSGYGTKSPSPYSWSIPKTPSPSPPPSPSSKKIKYNFPPDAIWPGERKDEYDHFHQFPTYPNLPAFIAVNKVEIEKVCPFLFEKDTPQPNVNMRKRRRAFDGEEQAENVQIAARATNGPPPAANGDDPAQESLPAQVHGTIDCVAFYESGAVSPRSRPNIKYWWEENPGEDSFYSYLDMNETFIAPPKKKSMSSIF